MKSKPLTKRSLKEFSPDHLVVTTRGIVARKSNPKEDKKLPPLVPPNNKSSINTPSQLKSSTLPKEEINIQKE